MNLVVLVPWRPGNGHRDQAWEYVRSRWQEIGLPVVTGDVPGPFNRSAARNAAARDAGAWDVAIFGDADTFVRDDRLIWAAIDVAIATGRVVQPHDEYIGLSARGSKALLSGKPHGRMVARTVLGAPLGIIVVPRAAWERLDGFDERFAGWGGEDIAFMAAARTLVGVRRLTGRIYHLWHPIDPGKRAYIASPKELTRRYRAAAGDPDAMRALIDERQEVPA